MFGSTTMLFVLVWATIMASLHAWESEVIAPRPGEPDPSAGGSSDHGSQSWEAEVLPEDRDADVEVDSDSMSPAEEFIEFSCELLYTRVLNARQFCSLMWHAGRAGVAAASSYGLSPNSASGNFQRKLQHSLPLYAEPLRSYKFSAPGSSREALGTLLLSLLLLLSFQCCCCCCYLARPWDEQPWTWRCYYRPSR